MEYEKVIVIHITHIDNLPSIIEDGCLFSDAQNIERGSCNQQIGNTGIKSRRLGLDVTCHPGTKVGDYVPFYFWHHSPMLLIIHSNKNPLEYTGGQEGIVHLVSTMKGGVEWADKEERKWAFTTSNAGAYYCDFYCDTNEIDKIDWVAVKKKYWSECKEEKQAEFLVQDDFPFNLFGAIVVINEDMKNQVESILEDKDHQPKVLVKRDWYYN